MILLVLIRIQFITASQHSVTWTKWSSFADDNFKCIFVNEHVWISLKCYTDGPISNKSALVSVMALHKVKEKQMIMILSSDSESYWPNLSYIEKLKNIIIYSISM